MIFGPNGMSPRDFAHLALGSPVIGIGMVATWMLLFVPVARVIVRADAARYLRSLPSPRWPTVALGVAALVGFQWPWIALWFLGAGAIGVAVVALVTVLIAGVAWWRFAPPKTGALRWRGPVAALFGTYARGLRRRAADALMRCAGLAVLAGLAAGLFCRNNQLGSREAGVIAAAVIAVVLTPGWAGTLLPPLETHRDSAWLAASTGISEQTRRVALASIVVAIYLVTALVAALAALAIAPDGGAWIIALTVASAFGAAFVATRAMIRSEHSDAMAMRVVIGAIAASAVVVIALGALGAVGAVAVIALGVLAVGTA
ncbi:MAG TPA: hypothetical protein VH143_28160 [Kofleriaceae bacterium]|nr:hypothetical protein [Kofleriaceae bacterium]